MAYTFPKYLKEYAQIRLENDTGAILAENGDIFVTDGSSALITDRYLMEDGLGVYLLDSANTDTRRFLRTGYHRSLQ
jgi:hypothetical protein